MDIRIHSMTYRKLIDSSVSLEKETFVQKALRFKRRFNCHGSILDKKIADMELRDYKDYLTNKKIMRLST